MPVRNGEKYNQIKYKEIKKTKLNDILRVITESSWTWTGHVVRIQDNRWTLRSTEWQVREGKTSEGRPKRGWQPE